MRMPLQPTITTGGLFFLNGFVFSSWVPHIPTVKAQLDMSMAEVGLALLCITVGAIPSIIITGLLLSRYRSKMVCAVSGALFCLALLFPLLAPNMTGLFIALVLFGIADGAFGVAMNAEGVIVEKTLNRPIMSSMHAMYSIGGVVGPLVAIFLLALGVSPILHVLSALTIGLLLVTLYVLYGPTFKVETTVGDKAFVLPKRPLILLGFLGLLVLSAEGAITDWSAVFLHEELGTQIAYSGIAYAAFSLLMTIGRAVGDRIVNRYGSKPVLLIGSIVAIIGFCLSLYSENLLIVVFGFMLIGAGLANMVPIVFSVAGKVKGIPSGVAVASVSTFGYFGFLAGPPIVGFIADWTSLTIALAMFIPLLFVAMFVTQKI